jgi:hypothetical protein
VIAMPGLILGGAMRAGFVAGALMALMDKKINRTIDLGYEKVEEFEDKIRLFLGKDD